MIEMTFQIIGGKMVLYSKINQQIARQINR